MWESAGKYTCAHPHTVMATSKPARPPEWNVRLRVLVIGRSHRDLLHTCTPTPRPWTIRWRFILQAVARVTRALCISHPRLWVLKSPGGARTGTKLRHLSIPRDLDKESVCHRDSTTFRSMSSCDAHKSFEKSSQARAQLADETDRYVASSLSSIACHAESTHLYPMIVHRVSSHRAFLRLT